MSTQQQQEPIPSPVLANALFATIGLRDLANARNYYPDVFAQLNITHLEQTFQQAVVSAMSVPAHAELKRKYETCVGRPIGETLDPVLMMMILLSATGLVIGAHGQDAGAIGESMERHVKSLESLASPQIKKAMERVSEIRIVDCRIPHPPSEPAYRSPRRMLRMLSLYWEVCREAILHQSTAMIGFQPYPLLPLMTNLRNRLDCCLTELRSVIDVAEALDSVHVLLDVLVGGEPDELSVVPEWTHQKLATVETFLAERRLVIGSDDTPLTPEEEHFLQVAHQSLTEHAERIQSHWKGMLAKIDRERKKERESASAARPSPAPFDLPTPEAITKICQAGEDDVTEFKDGRVDVRGVVREIAAMLHHPQGGRIFIGVNDDGTVSGCAITAQQFDQPLQNALRNNVRPPPAVTLHSLELVGGKRIIVVIVPPWNRRDVYHYDGRVMVRRGTNVFAASPEECRQMYAGQQTHAASGSVGQKAN